MEAEEYFNNDIGIDIWKRKYQYNNESFEDWLDRVSGGDTIIRNHIKNKKFIFGGRILANRGIPKRKLSYSNCYVITPPEDNLESIYLCNMKFARTFSYGGGAGTSLSKLSPRGAKINNAAKVTSGAVSFAHLFNETTKRIGQDGRRGAMMLSISSEHPDLEEFITAKANDYNLTKCNLSIEASDKFMSRALNNQMHKLEFVRETGEKITKEVMARELLETHAEINWNWSEPGIMFIDRINKYNILEDYSNYSIHTTNPCGEQPLPDGGACLLGSINLNEISIMYTDKGYQIDYEELKDVVFDSVFALNNVLDEGISRHPLMEQMDTATQWRQIGLGIMGYADLLIKLGYVYGSDKALSFTRDLMSVVTNTAFQASAVYAKENDVFPFYNPSKIQKSTFYKDVLTDETKECIDENGLANSVIMSIAPNGSISTMLQISGGVEPHYAFSYKRKTESLHGEDKYYDVEIPTVKEYKERHNTDELPDYFITSGEIPPIDRIKTQSTFQEFVDSAISSTVNLPRSATVEDVYNIYMQAWLFGLKGITVHRNGNKREGVLTTGEAEEEEEEITGLKRGTWAALSPDILYYKRKVYTGCGKIRLFIGYSKENDRIEEFWIKRSGQGGCERSLDNIAASMSGMLRLGGDIHNIQKAYDGIGLCSSFKDARKAGYKVSKGKNCGDAMLRKILEFRRQADVLEHIPMEEEEDLCGTPVPQIQSNNTEIRSGTICPDCSEVLLHSGGCIECPNCGYSKC